MQQCSHMQSRGHVSVLKQGEMGGATVVEGAMECFFQSISELAWLAMVWLGVCVGMNCCELGPWHTMANTQTLSWPSIHSLCPCVFSFEICCIIALPSSARIKRWECNSWTVLFFEYGSCHDVACHGAHCRGIPWCDNQPKTVLRQH